MLSRREGTKGRRATNRMSSAGPRCFSSCICTAAARSGILSYMGALAVSADGSAVDLHVAHLEMVDAVLAGRGLQGLADVAARLLARPVAVLVPKLGEAFAPAGALRSREAQELSRYVCARVGARPAAAPGTVALKRAVMTGAEMIGCVALLADGAGQPPLAGEMLG